MLRLLLLYLFWLAEICICHKPHPTTETRHMTNKLHHHGHSCFHFFSILLRLHTQDTLALILIFEVGHFARFIFLPLFFDIKKKCLISIHLRNWSEWRATWLIKSFFKNAFKWNKNYSWCVWTICGWYLGTWSWCNC